MFCQVAIGTIEFLFFLIRGFPAPHQGMEARVWLIQFPPSSPGVFHHHWVRWGQARRGYLLAQHRVHNATPPLGPHPLQSFLLPHPRLWPPVQPQSLLALVNPSDPLKWLSKMCLLAHSSVSFILPPINFSTRFISRSVKSMNTNPYPIKMLASFLVFSLYLLYSKFMEITDSIQGNKLIWVYCNVVLHSKMFIVEIVSYCCWNLGIFWISLRSSF